MSNIWKQFGITISVLIVLGLITYTFVYISRECNTNLDCSQNEYCAFNHKCYELQPTKIEKTSSSGILVFLITIISILTLSFLYYKTLNK
ncbi:MAG: hypothetical protein AABX29_08100 [Nanoarchaeota archaeon]